MNDIKFDLKYNHICKVLDLPFEQPIKFEYPKKQMTDAQLSINCYAFVQGSIELITKELAKHLEKIDYIKNIEVVGGYINLTIEPDYLIFLLAIQEIEFESYYTFPIPSLQVWRSIRWEYPKRKFTSDELKRLIRKMI